MVTWRDGQFGSHQALAGAAPDDDASQALRSRIDLSGLPSLTRAVTEQIICASADLCYANDLVCSEEWLQAAVAALAAGAPVIADGPMVAAGITGCSVICKAYESLTGRLARTAGITLAAAAVRLALGEAGPGAVWVVGSEPVAIHEILSRGACPALVIGLPAGLVDAADAKRALRAGGVPALTNVGEKGGPSVAAAAFLALLREARLPPEARLAAGRPLYLSLRESQHVWFCPMSAVPCVHSAQLRHGCGVCGTGRAAGPWCHVVVTWLDRASTSSWRSGGPEA